MQIICINIAGADGDVKSLCLISCTDEKNLKLFIVSIGILGT